MIRRMFTSLRIRNFRLFMAGQLVSNVGTWCQAVALGWLVYTLTGSGTACRTLGSGVPAIDQRPVLPGVVFCGCRLAMPGSTAISDGGVAPDAT